MMKNKLVITSNYCDGGEELDAALAEGWIVKFITPLDNHIRYILEKEEKEEILVPKKGEKNMIKQKLAITTKCQRKELDEALADGWIVKIITLLESHTEYILEKEEQETYDE